VISGQFVFSADDLHGFAGQGFEIAGGEIFFAELDVVDVGTGGFGDFIEEQAAAGGFVAGEGFAIGDVVEEQASVLSSQFSV